MFDYNYVTPFRIQWKVYILPSKLKKEKYQNFNAKLPQMLTKDNINSDKIKFLLRISVPPFARSKL